MKIIARIFLLFTLCVFVGVTSANAAMPCCMKMEKSQGQADMKDCHKAAKADDSQAAQHSDHAKHGKPNCDKCQCSHCMSVSYLPAADTATDGQAANGMASSLAVAMTAFYPLTIDNPPKPLL